MARYLVECGESVLNQESCGLRENNQIHLTVSACSELQALFLYSKLCTLLEFPIFKSNFAVFNDTALHFLPENAPIPKISEARPKYGLHRHEIVT